MTATKINPRLRSSASKSNRDSSTKRDRRLKHSKFPGAKLERMPFSKVPSRAIIFYLRNKLGFSQSELARVTGYSVRSIAAWESGKALSVAAKLKVTETERLRVMLSRFLPPEQLGEWMRTPNPAFEGQTPIQVMERGKSDRLWRMIFQIDSGVAN